MIVLHAGYLEGAFYVWGEVEPPAQIHPGKNKKQGKSKQPGQERGSKARKGSPYNPAKAQLSDAFWEADLTFDAETNCMLTAWLPSAPDAPEPSSPLLLADNAPFQDGGVIAPWLITAVQLSVEQAVSLFVDCHEKPLLAPGILIGEDLQYCATAFRYACALVTSEQFLPGLMARDDAFYACWKPVFLGHEATRLTALAAAMPAAVRALSREGAQEGPEAPAYSVLKALLNALVDHLVRDTLLKKEKSSHKPAYFDSIHDQWLYALRAPDGRMTGAWADLAHLNEQIEAWQHPVAVSAHTTFQLLFRLEEPDISSGDTDAWYLRYLLQAVDDPSLLIDVEKAWNPDKQTAALFGRRGFNPHEYLLISLGQAAGLVPFMEESLKQPRPGGFMMGIQEAYKFLTETAWLLRQAGYAVLLPTWWMRKGTRGKLTASASVSGPKMKSSSGLSLDNIVQFNWQVALGGEVLSLEEIELLSRAKTPLVNLRGQWVQVDLETIKSAVEFWKKAGATEATVRDVMRMAFGVAEAPGGLPFEGVEATGWIGDLLRQLEDGSAVEEIAVSEAFNGTLRPYQMRGYAWMAFLERWGLGACLADDMGLGKTIQTLALIQRNYDAGEKKPVLLVCPTSVMGNWQKEAERFAPQLPVCLHHGAQREKNAAALKKQIKGKAIVITGYPLLHRDFDHLSKIPWRAVILDEAQNIKNSETKQSKAARSIKADHRIALTGTPVENNIGELWSIMEFLNPGFLGTAADFKRQFFSPIQIERDQEVMQRLKQITGPFILRRLKTDKSIINDLPDKQEMNVFTTLTKEQASLYEAVVKDMSEALNTAAGIQRKGLVLATLTKLKQVCNHPAQFLHDESSIPDRSGKLTRLTEMLEEIIHARECALIFTQFTEMGEMIRRHVQELFGKEVLFLHGGVSKKKRDLMVERFQHEESGPPFFLLSLKAGGTGLNLTRANHVFHFDRWWNPAVENQATDRAFRIGQTRQVQVHKFVCLGTVEERIDEMINNKREIAESTVGAGENWITELSTDDLRSLFELRREVVGG